MRSDDEIRFDEMWISEHGVLVANVAGGGGLSWSLDANGGGIEIAQGAFIREEAVAEPQSWRCGNVLADDDDEGAIHVEVVRLLEATTGRVHISTGEPAGTGDRERVRCGLAITNSSARTFPADSVPPHWRASVCARCESAGVRRTVQR